MGAGLNKIRGDRAPRAPPQDLPLLLSNDPDKKGKQVVLLLRNTLSSHRNVFIFTQRMHKSTKRQFTKENVFEIHF